MNDQTDARPDTGLHVSGVSKTFLTRGERRRGEAGHLAVDNVSFELRPGEILGVAGGSGSGKTTLARCLIRLVEPDAGSIVLGTTEILALRGTELRALRRRIQMVFQDPYSSLNPRMSVQDAIVEAGRVHARPGSGDAAEFAGRLLERVHLPATFAQRRPRDLSGGQRQRVAIARALAVEPEILIADEAVSALDVSVQAQLLRTFKALRDELGVSIIFVSHQLAVLAEIADRILVLNRGRIVEEGSTRDVFRNPQDAYTRALIAAHPNPDPRNQLFTTGPEVAG